MYCQSGSSSARRQPLRHGRFLATQPAQKHGLHDTLYQRPEVSMCESTGIQKYYLYGL